MKVASQEPIAAILLMGGVGNRFSQEKPKQFALLEEKPLYSYALETLQKSALFDQILIVCHPNYLHLIEPQEKVTVVPGGPTRQASCYQAIQALFPSIEYVLIHDAVRPFVSTRILKENVEKVKLYGAIDTCIPSSDTIVFSPNGEKIESIGPRSYFLKGQTPQTFRKDLLEQAHLKAIEDQIDNATDDCSLVLRLGHLVHIVYGEESNFKITIDLDLQIASFLVSSLKESKKKQPFHDSILSSSYNEEKNEKAIR